MKKKIHIIVFYQQLLMLLTKNHSKLIGSNLHVERLRVNFFIKRIKLNALFWMDLSACVRGAECYIWKTLKTFSCRDICFSKLESYHWKLGNLSHNSNWNMRYRSIQFIFSFANELIEYMFFYALFPHSDSLNTRLIFIRYCICILQCGSSSANLWFWIIYEDWRFITDRSIK